MRTTSPAFNAFSMNVGLLLGNGIVIRDPNSQEFKVLMLMLQKTIRSVESKSDVKIGDEANPCPVHGADFPYQDQKLILGGISSEIGEYYGDVESAGHVDEIECLGLVKRFIDCYLKHQEINYQTEVALFIKTHYCQEKQ